MKARNVRLHVLGALREIYLSLFYMFFEVSQWRGAIKIYGGVLGVTVIFVLLLIDVIDYIELFFSSSSFAIDLGIMSVGSLIIYGFNYYILYLCGAGPNYVHKFKSFGYKKRAVLFSVCVLVVVIVACVSYKSMAAHRHYIQKLQ